MALYILYSLYNVVPIQQNPFLSLFLNIYKSLSSQCNATHRDSELVVEYYVDKLILTDNATQVNINLFVLYDYFNLLIYICSEGKKSVLSIYGLIHTLSIIFHAFYSNTLSWVRRRLVIFSDSLQTSKPPCLIAKMSMWLNLSITLNKS